MADDTVVAQILLDFRTQNEEAVARAAAQLKTLDVESAGAARSAAQLDGAWGQSSTSLTRATAAVQQHDASLRTVAKSASTVGLTIGAAAVALDVFAGRAASNFQRAMEMIHTQAGASQAEVESLTKSVLAMAGSVGTGPQQLADGLYHIESAGLRGAEALNVLHAAAIGAKVGNADLQAVTQSLISATVSHIGGVKNEIDAMAQLNAIVGTGDVRMQDLAAALSTGILPAATVVGLHLRDVGAAMATLTDNAVPAEEAATRLRMTFSLMAAPAQVGAKALASIGLSATQLGEDMRKPNGLLTAVEDLKTHLEQSGKTAVEQEQIIARAFGGGRSSSAIETLLTQIDRLKSKYEEQAKLVGQFGEAWDRTQKTAAFATSQFEANAQTLEITLGAALLPSIVAIEKAMTPVAQAIQHIASVAPGAVTAVSAIALGFGGLSLAMKAAMALAEPYRALLNVLGKNEAGAGEQGIAAAAGIAKTGAAAAAATAPVDAFAASMAFANKGMGASGPAAVAGARDMSAMAAGSEEAAASTGVLSGALDTLLGPAGLVLLGATLGTIAYEKSPAFRSEVSKAGDALQQGLAKSVLIATDAIGLYQTKLQEAGSWLDKMGAAADSARNHNQTFGGFLQQQIPLLGTWASALGKVADAYGKVGNAIDSLPQGGVETFGGPKQPPPVYNKNDLKADTSVADQVKYFNSQSQATFDAATKQAGADLKAYALAVEAGSTAQKNLLVQAVGSAQYAKALGDRLQEATIKVDRASGDLAGALQATSKQLSDKYQNALAAVVLAMRDHAGNVRQLVQVAAGAARDQAGLSKQQQDATSMIAKAAGLEVNSKGKLVEATTKVTDAFAALVSNLQKQATTATGNVAENLLGKHNGNLDQLVSIGAQKVGKLNNANAKEDEARLLIARRLGDWATVISIEQGRLQRAYDGAVDKLALDRRQGAPASTIAADETGIAKARGNLDSFTKGLDAAKKAGEGAAKSFSDLQSTAQTKAKAALDAYALGIMNGAKNLGELRDKAIAAAAGSKRFDDALREATASIARLGGAAQFVAEQQQAQKRYDDALNTVAQDLKMSGVVTQAHWQALVKANTGLGGFSTALQQAQDRLKPPGPAADLRTDQDAAQKTYDDAVATVTRDIIAHGQATRKDLQALTDAKNGLDLFTGVAKKVAALFTTPVQRFRDQESAAQQKAANMADRLADSLMHGGSGAGIWADAAISAARVVQQYADAHAKAQAIIQAALAKTGEGFITASQRLSLLNQAIQDLIDAAVTNQTRTKPMPGAETGASQGGTGEQSSSITKDLDAAIRDRIDLERRLNVETRKVALAEGDFSTVFSIDQQALSKSFDDLAGAFFTGTGDVAALTAAYERNKAVVDAETAARIKAADAVGDHSQALQLITQQLQGNYDNAIAGITEKLLRHQQVTQSDIDAAAAYGQSLKALTQAQWDANFAVADAAERAKLLSDRFSSIVSQASTITSAQGSVVSANLTVFNDQAAEQTRLLQSLVTEVTDQTAIISAQSGVVKAGYDGQIAAVKDQSGIEQALADIQKATTAAELAVAQQELVVARDTYQVDQEAARQNGIIARDQVRIAQVKAASDRADAQAAAAVARAHLKVDTDNVTLTEDQLQLQALMLPPLEIIASAFGDVQAYQQQVVRAVTTINADQRAIWTDQQNLAVATATQQQVQGAGQLAAAQAAQQLALDQASAEASSSAGQLKIQQDTARLQSLQYAAQQQTNNILSSASSSNNALLSQLVAMYQRFFQVIQSGALTGTRNYGARGSAFLNQFTVEAHGAPSP